jgi:clan AA aspartic protease (TIGR02281 family)
MNPDPQARAGRRRSSFDPNAMRASDAPAGDLAAFLVAQGFAAVPLRVNAVGHFELAAEVNGQPARLLLDTGASHTVLATPSAARLGLRTAPSAERAGGVGTSDHATETTRIDELRLGAVRLPEVERPHRRRRAGRRRAPARGGGHRLRPCHPLPPAARGAVTPRRAPRAA